MECRCDELRDKIRNMVITFRNDSNDAIAEINRLSTQLAEAAKAAEEMELALQKASDEFRKQLAERDAVAAENVVERARLADENAALRAEVERLKLIISGKTFVDERKQAAQEIIQYIIDQGMIDAGTISRPMPVYEIDRSDIDELRQRYGLEGER